MNLKTFSRALSVTGLLAVTCSTLAAPLSTDPVPRTKQFDWMSLSSWYERHAADVAEAELGEARVVFLGDSITQGWDSELWQKHFEPLGAVNFAIGGDLTQNMLWRLDHGNVENLDPQLVVLMAGVNNYLHNKATPEDTFLGVKAVIDKALEYYPNAELVLQAVLPFGAEPNTPERQWVTATNTLLRQLDRQPRITYYDFGDLFLEDDGSISTDIMPDHLHPGRTGYQLWIKELLPVVKVRLGE